MGVSRHESRAGSRSAHAATGGSRSHAHSVSDAEQRGVSERGDAGMYVTMTIGSGVAVSSGPLVHRDDLLLIPFKASTSFPSFSPRSSPLLKNLYSSQYNNQYRSVCCCHQPA